MGKFSVLYADPPWSFRDKLDKTRSLDNHYSTLTLDQIKTLRPWSVPVQDLGDKNSCLLLWVPNSMIPEGLEVLRAWNYEYKTSFVWVKPKLGMGSYFRSAHETLLFGKRGKIEVRFKGQPSWILAPTQMHSQKPEEVYAIIERMFEGPYCELFARQLHPGWSAYGDQLPDNKDNIKNILDLLGIGADAYTC